MRQLTRTEVHAAAAFGEATTTDAADAAAVSLTPTPAATATTNTATAAAAAQVLQSAGADLGALDPSCAATVEAWPGWGRHVCGEQQYGHHYHLGGSG